MPHIHEHIDSTVSVYIVHGDRVLLRKHDKYGFWLGVGGHIELNEDPNEAAVREVKEEVGLDVVLWDGNRHLAQTDTPHRELIPPVSLNRHHVSPTHEHVDMIYFASSATDRVVPENPDDEWCWAASEELRELELLPDVRFYAGLALRTISGLR